VSELRLREKYGPGFEGIVERDGRWWKNGGEITAPIWSDYLNCNILPPWWPIYTDPRTGERFTLERWDRGGLL
jgi:hypothetical protein